MLGECACEGINHNRALSAVSFAPYGAILQPHTRYEGMTFSGLQHEVVLSCCLVSYSRLQRNALALVLVEKLEDTSPEP